MGIFDKVLSTLGIRKAEAATPPPSEPAAASVPEVIWVDPPSSSDGSTPAPPAPPSPPAAATPPAPVAIDVVDVVAQLEERAAAHPEKLNWRVSIVDLLKLLGIDSSLAARKELAQELGIADDLMGDSAKMNMWLHKTVLARIAANGGNVPADLLD